MPDQPDQTDSIHPDCTPTSAELVEALCSVTRVFDRCWPADDNRWPSEREDAAKTVLAFAARLPSSEWNVDHDQWADEAIGEIRRLRLLVDIFES